MTQGFAPVELCAHAAGIPVPRMRVWAVRYRHRIAAVCDRRTRRTLYCIADVMTLERDTRDARNRRAGDPHNKVA